MDKQKIGFIGLGLIGGSIAKAIRQYFPDYEIVAFDKNKEALALATQESVIDVAATTIDDNFYHCSYIFLCAPVSFNSAYLKQLTCYMHEDCILTDVGSVKTNIHEEAETLGLGKYFIGGHPMAGSEKSGYSNSKAMLIENAYYVLTPSVEVSDEKVARYESFVTALKALPVILDYKKHDYDQSSAAHYCSKSCQLCKRYRYERRADEASCRRRIQRYHKNRLFLSDNVAEYLHTEQGEYQPDP